MLGIPVKRLQTEVWVIAAVMSFLGVFLQAGVTGLPPGGSFTWSVLLRTLAALVLGRMTNLGAVAASSVALGVLENAMQRGGDGALVGPVLLTVILVGLLARRRGATRLAAHEHGSWALAGEFHALPLDLARLGRVRAFRVAVGSAVTLLVVVAPQAMGTAGVLKAGAMLVFATIGLSMVVLSGWAGQVSVGQMAFVGTGGAVGAWSIAERGDDPVIAMVLAGTAGAALAVIVGIPALRLRGLHLAVVTLALAVAASSALFSNAIWRWIPTGTFERPKLLGRVDIDSPERLYWLAFVVLVLAVVAVTGLRRSRFGRVLVAQRDNEVAASSFGVGVVAAKLAAFALSGFIAAVAGAVFVLHQAAFRDENYDVGAGLAVFVAAVIGGLGSPLGGILGAVYLRGAQWLLPGNWQILASAAGVLIVLLEALGDELQERLAVFAQHVVGENRETPLNVFAHALQFLHARGVFRPLGLERSFDIGTVGVGGIALAAQCVDFGGEGRHARGEGLGGRARGDQRIALGAARLGLGAKMVTLRNGRDRTRALRLDEEEKEEERARDEAGEGNDGEKSIVRHGNSPPKRLTPPRGVRARNRCRRGRDGRGRSSAPRRADPFSFLYPAVVETSRNSRSSVEMSPPRRRR